MSIRRTRLEMAFMVTFLVVFYAAAYLVARGWLDDVFYNATTSE